MAKKKASSKKQFPSLPEGWGRLIVPVPPDTHIEMKRRVNADQNLSSMARAVMEDVAGTSTGNALQIVAQVVADSGGGLGPPAGAVWPKISVYCPDALKQILMAAVKEASPTPDKRYGSAAKIVAYLLAARYGGLQKAAA